MPLALGADRPRPLAAYSESFGCYDAFGWPPLRSIRKNGWKYIHSSAPELFHVSEDPRELNNLADDNDSGVTALLDWCSERK